MTNNSAPQEEILWEQWHNERDVEAGDELVKRYMHLVMYHVQRIAAHLPQSVSKEDIRSLGLIGLYDALEKFDVTRDLKFDTYASFRVRGAIMDGLRKEDWLPRSIRDKSKRIEQAADQLEQQLQREATSKEVADRLGVSEQEVDSVMKDTVFANLLSIEEKPKDTKDEHKEGIGYSLPDQNTPTPHDQLVKEENYQDLAQGIQQLNEKEQLVVSLFYQEELTLTEIGHVMSLTTSRISQIHARALFKLRNVLKDTISM
ncbi:MULTISPECIES: FliA/WhiG family RNA polymerase sigma factor [Pontibacillus]|uniref:FliA/WhiG family RNA polymerase sigma factor n=1 Tax=Pontibacillus chungwhensis TaxID=265426 RepID=A0ABY8V5Z3_9BACI|nr:MULTISPECIES: FliA/WhiG family RNA polymerase sigma factor [Pontibacillus]MCD5322709.1 FliA/WhiG family RNA polymerase sigma factor [Pontibacillus sp. HN14]WIF99985.1 FliA/WhiG family RNA polymerase sigma factor [Pontibacillus chungwhensis]